MVPKTQRMEPARDIDQLPGAVPPLAVTAEQCREAVEQPHEVLRLPDRTLRGDRAGQHSIRINVQRRICFRWTDEGSCDVEIVDYH